MTSRLYSVTHSSKGMHVKVFQGLIVISALYLPAVYGQVAEKKLTFDVPYGQYETLLRHNVKGEGQLTCKVVTDQQDRGERWVPSVTRSPVVGFGMRKSSSSSQGFPFAM